MFLTLPAESPPGNKRYRWYILALATATGTLVVAIPFSCMPVLFQEISDELGLSLVQIGVIWGLGNLPVIFMGIVAGALSDRFGIKGVLFIFCIMSGITGALRGISDSYFVLAVMVFVSGAFRMVVPVTLTKTIGIWFKGENLGMAMGISALGMGLGLMLGPLISATIMSPALGGWRNVLYFYGAIATGVGILWLIMGREPTGSISVTSGTVAFRQTFSQLIRMKALWLIGITFLLRNGCMIGMAGYLPLYLRGKGWEVASADGVLAGYFAASTVFVVPLSFLSDKIGSRKAILFPALFVTMMCVALLSVAEGSMVWVLMLLAGVFMDSYMSVATTMLVETEGLNPGNTGTALGFIFSVSNIGNVAAPPIGNSLAGINTGAPFLFWAFLAFLAVFSLALTKETGRRGMV